jgi:hypothetical protein
MLGLFHVGAYVLDGTIEMVPLSADGYRQIRDTDQKRRPAYTCSPYVLPSVRFVLRLARVASVSRSATKYTDQNRAAGRADTWSKRR